MPDPITWELSWPLMLAALGGGYLLGSIPFGLVLTRLAGYGDIRTIGSGNIGATNVLRTGNKPLALATLLLDSGKGAIAVGLAWAAAGQEAAMLAAAGSMLGTAVVARISSLSALVAFAVATVYAGWIGMIQAAGADGRAEGAAWAPGVIAGGVVQAAVPTGLWLLLLFITALVYIRHRENIRRLLNGTEPRIGAGKKAG